MAFPQNSDVRIEAPVDAVSLCHGRAAGQTTLTFRNADRIEAGLYGCLSVLVSNEPEERRNRCITKLIADGRRNFEELPNLSGLEGDLQNLMLSAVREGFNFGVKNRYSWCLDRVNKMSAVRHLLFAFFRKRRQVVGVR